MDVSQKEGPQRSRRMRSVPPPDVAETAALVARAPMEDVPRFAGAAAPLAVLAAELRQARSDQDRGRVAALSVRLSRQLLRRGIELREAIGLLEKAFEIAPDPAIARELGEAWAGVGDYVRGASYLVQASEGQPESERAKLLCQTAQYYAQAGKVPQALQALKQAMTVAPLDPTPHELLGALGFWADFPLGDASRAYLEAARLRARAGDEALALEALLRAFEIDPGERVVADALASALRQRRRAGAADEIIREHLRSGSAAARAAHYERTFLSVLAERKWALALEAALEAELDIELDLDALDAALDELEQSDVAARAGRAGAPSPAPKTFEGFLVGLGRHGWPTEGAAAAVGGAHEGGAKGARFAEWLVVLASLHVCNWGEAEVRRVLARLQTLLSAAPVDEAEESLHELRSRLTRAEAPPEELRLRTRIALLEAARSNWQEAYDVLQPMLDDASGHRDFRALGVGLVAASRARQGAGRARMLAHFARFLPDEPAAVASAVAAETLLAEGMVHAAADAARYAVEADPASPRAVATQALVALTHPERATPGLIESSLAVLVARGTACHLLAESAAQAGAPHLALSWAERQVALRPADPAAVREVLERAAQAGDAARLVERIDALLEQPVPMVEIGPDIAQALRHLLELSHDEAERAARLVLVKAGIRSLDFREALEEIATAAKRPRLAADLRERLLVLAPSAQRPQMLLELAELRLECADTLAAVRALRRALASGAARERIEAALARVVGPLEPDAEITKLETELEMMPDAESQAPDAQTADPVDKARLLRRLGVMRFDLAQDTQGAIAAWMRAADLDRELGAERIAHYLTVVAGADEAPNLLEKAASYTDDPLRKARLLGLAARAMLEVKRPADALRLAVQALEQAPLQTEFLTVAERAASADDIGRLEDLYRLAADAALGRYGERAIHYRAARILEKRGQSDAALRHAGQAFIAVPAEGAAFVLMARLADASSDPTPAIQAIELVAERTKDEAGRSRWLDKAASLASMAAGGSRQRVEILLRAAHLRSEETTIVQLEAALLDLELLDKSEQKALERRVQALGNEALVHSSGAHGALLCIALAGLYLRVFDDLELCSSCLIKAVSCDIEVPGYQKLREFAPRLASQTGLFEQLEGIARAGKSERGQLLGRAVAEFLADVAAAAGKASVGAELLTLAAADAPEDLELVGLARQAAEASGRSDLLATIRDLLPPEESARLLLARLSDLSDEAALAALLDLELGAVGPELELAVQLELGTRLLAAERPADAVDVFRHAVELAPSDLRAVSGLETAAERALDLDELARVLKLRADLTTEPAHRRDLLLRRARLLERELARIGEARSVLEALLASGDDAEVLDLLAQSHDAAGDAERAAELWLRARAATSESERAHDFARRAARAYGEAGLERAAVELLTPLELDPETARLLLQFARRAGDRQTELQALVVIAPLEPPGLRDEAFLAAARLALSLGDVGRAEELSRLAADGRSDDALQARIVTWQLALKRMGALGRDDAGRLLGELGAAGAVAGASQREIRAYLLAVATEVVEGEGAARSLLARAIEEQGKRPLLAAALGRLLTRGTDSADPAQALELYEAAIGGDLHGLLREGDLLLQAAQVACDLGDPARARGFASAVGDDDPRRPEAARLLEDLAAEEARLLRLEREQREAEEARAAAEREAEEAREAAAREEAARQEAAAREEAARQEAAAREEAARQEAAARSAAGAETERASTPPAAGPGAAKRSSSELQVTVERELSAADAAARRREEGARERLREREKKAEEALRREQAEAAREAARREDAAARRRLSQEAVVESLAPRTVALSFAVAVEKPVIEVTSPGAEVVPTAPGPTAAASASASAQAADAPAQATDAPAQAADATAQASPEATPAPTSVTTTAEERERSRAAREEALRLAREEAARERAMAPAADQKRASTVPPPRVTGRPAASRSLAPLSRRGSDRPAAPVPTAELDFPAEETSVVQVTLGELREVDELTPEEEAVAAHLEGWEAEPESEQRSVMTAHGSQRAEEELVSRLESGDVEAGIELLDRLQGDRSRARDAVAVAGHLVLLRPGDGSLLGRLVASASRDGNEALALAVRHVLGSFGAGDRVVAPPLERVAELPERTQAVLFRGLRSAGVEALTLVWEHAAPLFRREPAAYGVTGGDRVPATSPTPLAELYRDAARVLGMMRTPLFRVGTGEDISMRVLLLQPPAVQVSGRVDQVTTELGFHFGAALGAAMPEHALLYGLEPEALGDLLSALVLSFGGDPKASAGAGQTQAVRLASLLWEAIPSRAQRRLSSLCSQKEQLSIETCLGYSTLVLRRVGLLVSGDIRTAVVDACESAGIAPPRSLAELAQAARIAPAVADLLQLAVSPEYAELRFRATRSS